MKISEFKKLSTKKPKYGNKKCEGYDSKRECTRARVLANYNKAGIIHGLREQVPYELLPSQYVQGANGKMICGRRAMKYIADFVYMEGEIEIVEDSKGYRTKEYKQKKNLMKKIFGIEIRET